MKTVPRARKSCGSPVTPVSRVARGRFTFSCEHLPTSGILIGKVVTVRRDRGIVCGKCFSELTSGRAPW